MKPEEVQGLVALGRELLSKPSSLESSDQMSGIAFGLFAGLCENIAKIAVIFENQEIDNG